MSQSSLLTSPTNSGKFSGKTSRSSSSLKIYKSLEDIQKNLTNLDNFLMATEDILRREKFRDLELYQRERARKERKLEPSSAPPLSFKNGKIFCLGDDGTKFNASNVQLTHDIVKQIINNEKKFLCYDMVSDDPDPTKVHVSEEQDIFLTHEESGEDDEKLKSYNNLMMQFSPTSTVSSKIDDDVMKTLEEDLIQLDYNRSETMECMVVAPDSPE
jgi:hypothetical protein